MSISSQETSVTDQRLLVSKSLILSYVQRSSDSYATDVSILSPYDTDAFHVYVTNSLGNYTVVFDHIILTKVLLFAHFPISLSHIKFEKMDDSEDLLLIYKSN